MKIEHTVLTGAGGVTNHETAKTEQAKLALNRYGKTNVRDAAGGSSDRVELSALGQRLRELTGGDPGRERRIEELAALVASGGYEADSAAIGEKLVDEALSESGPGNAPGPREE